MNNNVKRCVKCILPINYPNITFDDSGLCNYCSEFKAEDSSTRTKKKKKLDEIIRKSKGKGKYDAIVGISGGKDSSYAAYYLKKEYDLKLLGFHFDNGYNSDYAIENIKTVIDTLEMDLISVRPNQSFVKKLYAHFLKKNGEFCSVCNNLGYLTTASFYSDQKSVCGFSPLGVGGWSKKYEYQPGVSVTSMQHFFETLTPDLIEELMTQPCINKNVVLSYMKLSDPRQAQINTTAYKELGESAMNLIQLPDYIDWDLRKMPHILIKELGWKQPPNRHDSHFDCALFPIKEFLKYRKYGLTQETIKNSVMIREGVMTRKEAIQQMSLEQREEPDNYGSFLTELGLSINEVNEKGEWSK